MTFNGLEVANNKRGWKENGDWKLKILSANNLLVCDLGTGIRLITTITGGTHQSLLKQNGQQISGIAGTSLGTWQCQLSIPIVLMATLKRGVN